MSRGCFIPRRLVLFDLDHTLIPFDSGLAWLRFLVGHGVLAADFPDYYLDCCRQYLRGTLALRALHRVAMAPLARHRRASLNIWRAQFASRLATHVPPAAGALVARQRAVGALCCIVTTTNDFVAAPFAAHLGVEHLLASTAQLRGSRFTGEIAGPLCHGEGKIERVDAWLAGQGLNWADFAESVFYTDSASDLPLLQRVGKAVAVRPDNALRVQAERRGWTIVEELADAP